MDIIDLIRKDPNISQQFKGALYERCDCGSLNIYKVSPVKIMENGVVKAVVDKPICEFCYADILGEV